MVLVSLSVTGLVLELVECLAGDKLCQTDRVGFEAIAQLHTQIDDDHDGSLDRKESAEVRLTPVMTSPSMLE